MERERFRRASSVVLLSVLVVLAGCVGASPLSNVSPGDGNSTETAAEADPETSQPADRAEAADLPGVSKDSIENATALAAASREGLVESGYVGAFRLESVVRQNGRSRNMTMAQREIVEPGARRLLFQVKRMTDTRQSRMDAWANGSTAVLRESKGGSVNYRAIDGERIRGQVGGEQLVSQYVGAGEFELTDTNRTGEGTFFTFRSDKYVEQSSQQMPAAENVTSYEAVAVFDEEGRLRYLDVKTAYTGPNGGSAILRIRYAVRQVGDVTAGPPSWVEKALADDTSTETDDGHDHDHG